MPPIGDSGSVIVPAVGAVRKEAVTGQCYGIPHAVSRQCFLFPGSGFIIFIIGSVVIDQTYGNCEIFSGDKRLFIRCRITELAGKMSVCSVGHAVQRIKIQAIFVFYGSLTDNPLQIALVRRSYAV